MLSSAKCIVLCFLVAAFVRDLVFSVAIYKDTDVLKKSQRRGKELNDLPLYDDDYSVSRRRGESQWESAEWPQEMARGGSGRDNSYESEERPYNWYYYNKFITNGRFNHLYNGPHMDTRAGMGQGSFGTRPKILPRPVSSFGRSMKREFLT